MRKLANVVLSGNLDYISLGELIQLLGSNGSTGVVRISSKYAKDPAWIYFRQGNPVDAVNGPMSGLEAANSLFGWIEGTFEFSKEPVDIPNRIQRTRMELVLNGCRMLDDGVIHEVGPVSYERQAADATAVMEKVPLVKGPSIDYSYIVEEEEFRDGDEIFIEGLYGSWIWILMEGRVAIVRNTTRGRAKLLTLGEGAFLGSIAGLASKNVRNATGVAEGKVSLGVLDVQRLSEDFFKMSAPFRQMLLCLDKRLNQATQRTVDIYQGDGELSRKEIKSRRLVMKQGTHTANFFGISRGDALLVRQEARRSLALAHLGPGDFIGSPPFLDLGQEPGSAGVYVGQEFEAVPLKGAELRQEYESASVTIRNMADHMAACVAVTSVLAWELNAKEPTKSGKGSAPSAHPRNDAFPTAKALAPVETVTETEKLVDAEKRKHDRIESLNTVAFLCLDEAEVVVGQGMGRTLNLSENGILLNAFRPIGNCAWVRIHIGLRDELVDIKGRIVHSQRDPSAGFCYGIEFVDLEEADRSSLATFVKEFKPDG